MNKETKRGPKTKTLITIPLSELVKNLPSSGNVKVSRVWYDSVKETLGFSDAANEPTENQDPEPENKIFVESINLDSED